jgi:hypothetical protein
MPPHPESLSPRVAQTSLAPARRGKSHKGSIWHCTLPINYWFWWPAFLILVYVDGLFLSEIEGIARNHEGLVFWAGALNSLVLTFGLAVADGLIERLGCKFLRRSWGGIAGVVMASFFADFLLFKMMAIHLGTGLRLLFETGWQQALLTIEATGVRPQHLRDFLLAMGGAFVVGGLLMRVTWALSKRVPVSIPVRRVAAVALAAVFGLTGWELVCQRRCVWSKAWQEVHRLMPFSLALLHPQPGDAIKVGQLRQLREAKGLSEALDRMDYNGARRPDVFVFIIESARGDYVDTKVTPHLEKLSRECVKFHDSVANANASHVSWFSLLTANQPLYSAMTTKRKELWGSVPLRMLKRMGYEIHVLAATYLHYHNVDEMAFGANLELADSFTDARMLGDAERPDRDRQITGELLRRIDEKQGGRIFFVFYESTHHDYYWPSDHPAPFQPVLERWNYFDFNVDRRELTMIENRYKNALHFVDSLVGQVLERLETKGQYGGSLMLVTGDHGEEFLEHGKLVHASELWREQTHVPFLLKPPKDFESDGSINTERLTASHVDFLPTVLDYCGVNVPGQYDGESLFRKRADFVVTVDDNGARDPYRFCILSGDVKAWFEYGSCSTVIALEQSIYLRKVTDRRDKELSNNVEAKEIIQALKETLVKGLYPLCEQHLSTQ